MSPKLFDGNLHVSLIISFSHAIQAFITSPMLVVYVGKISIMENEVNILKGSIYNFTFLMQHQALKKERSCALLILNIVLVLSDILVSRRQPRAFSINGSWPGQKITSAASIKPNVINCHDNL